MNKSTFLLLHGALSTQNEMQALKDQLELKGHEVYALTFSGHGKDSVLKEFRIETFAQDIDQFIEKHQLKNVHLFGHSMGGYAALYYQVYAENPRTMAITTYGTKFDWSEISVRQEIPKLNPATISAKVPNLKNKLVMDHGQNWEKILSNTVHMMEHLEKLDGLTEVDLNSIKIPVVLMLGEEDKMVTEIETQKTAYSIEKCAVEKVPASPHEFHRANLNYIVNFLCQRN